MLQLSVREFNQNISKALKNIPVEITNRGYVVARIIPPGWFWKEIAEKAGAKYKANAMETITKITKKDKDEAIKSIEEGEDVATPKNAGERSSDTPSDSATPPPKTAGALPGVLPPPTAGYPLTEDPNKILKIPLLRKTLCPKHSVFSCGCPEKEKRAR